MSDSTDPADQPEHVRLEGRVDVALADNVHRTAALLATDPSSGHVRPRVHTELVEDVNARSVFTQYGHEFEFLCDESEGRGGRGSAPSPLRYLLSSIAFCLQVWCAKVAAVHGVDLRQCHVDVDTFMDMRGEHLVDGVAAHPQWFVLTVRLVGPPDAAAARELVEEARRRCPVTSLVALAVPVALQVQLDGRVVHDTTDTLSHAGTKDATTCRQTP